MNTLAGTLLLASLSISAHDSGHVHGHEVHGHVHGNGTANDDRNFERAPQDDKRYVLGAEGSLYLWNSEWLQLPTGREWFGSTHGCMVTDAANNVYISADSGAAVQVFSSEGEFLRSFGEDWGAGIHGLSIHREADTEQLYIAQSGTGRVFKSSLQGEVLQELEFPAASGKYEDPASYRPTSIAVAPDGRMFVADGYGLSWIHQYDKDGEYRGSFGGPGDKPENLRTPHGLWMDTSAEVPTLLVADRENHRIARFALDGTYLDGTDPESGLLRRPCHIQFHDKLAVVADLAGRVTLLDNNLKLIAQLGDNPNLSQHANFNVTPDQWQNGAFMAPHCARFDADGNILVMDWNVAGRITRLEPLHRLGPK